MKFQARTTCPEKGNNYYTRYESGGWSGAVKGKPTADCDALANCVGYSYGRIAEASGRDACDLCEPCNPGDFDKYLYNGCTKGDTPKLGAIIVWLKDGSTTSGHVGNVEAILDNDTIVSSESHYNGATFDLNIHTTKDDKRYYKSGYTFQYFIYSPYIETDEDTIASLEAQLATANGALTTAQSNLQATKAELTTAKEENTKLAKELAEAEKKVGTLTSENETLTTEKESAEKRVELYKASCETYGDKLGEQQAFINQQEQKIEELENLINEDAEAIESYKSKAESLEKTLAEVVPDYANSQAQIDDLGHRLAEAIEKAEKAEASKDDINGDGTVDLLDVWELLKIVLKKK